MKKPVIIGVSALVLFASASFLFAQTATGSSLITQMKAGARAFNANLLTELNGTVTNPSDYNSSPLIGKETGDMLTAGEWNRMLELVAQGGGGGGSGWVNVPLTDTASFDPSCDYRVKLRGPGTAWDNLNGIEPVFLVQQVSPTIIVLSQTASGVNHVLATSKDKWRQNGVINSTITILEISKRCGGTGGGSGATESSWVNVPLTDTADYDTSCQYRLSMSFADDVNRKWHNATSAVYQISWMSTKFLGLSLENTNQYFGIPSTTKGKYGYRSTAGVFTEATNVTVTKLEKKC